MPSVSRRQHNLMEAVAHNPTFAKKAGIAQSVGRDFVAADSASGKYKAKDKPMHKAKAHPPGSGPISPRKVMAGTDKGGNFGTKSYADMNGGNSHPDATAHTGMKGAMSDADRGTPGGVMHTKGHLAAQAAPRHGPHHPGGYGEHFNRNPKA